jgi:hypothetical protein
MPVVTDVEEYGLDCNGSGVVGIPISHGTALAMGINGFITCRAITEPLVIVQDPLTVSEEPSHGLLHLSGPEPVYSNSDKLERLYFWIPAET